jgi:hypothetical protein
VSVSGAKTRLVASMVAGLLVLVATAVFLSLSPQGSAFEAARDFEDCVASLPAEGSVQRSHGPSNDVQAGSMADCNARFAGRRKPGGGYTYFDFMQDRSFDIAGPNPTPEERNRIDREYMGFLDMKRRENASAELAKKQDEQLQADLERARQPVGRPLVLTPKIPSAQVLKRQLDRLKATHCEDSPPASGWSKLSAVVKDAFASSFPYRALTPPVFERGSCSHLRS